MSSRTIHNNNNYNYNNKNEKREIFSNVIYYLHKKIITVQYNESHVTSIIVTTNSLCSFLLYKLSTHFRVYIYITPPTMYIYNTGIQQTIYYKKEVHYDY